MTSCLLLYTVLCTSACEYDELIEPLEAVATGLHCVPGGSVDDSHVCEFEAEGYSCTAAVCVNGVWNTTVPCVGEPCEGGPVQATVGVDYTPCNQKVTGAYCDLRCQPGRKKVAGSLFILTCLSTQYNDTSGVECLPVCATLSSQGPTYLESYCAGLVEGATCEVTCAPGYTGGTALYTCNTGGSEPTISPGETNPTCSPNTCTSPRTPTPGVNYTSCTNLTTGSSCTPTCSSGYRQGAATSFVLTCDENGMFDGSFRCLPNACVLGPTNPAAHGDYAQCNNLTSGDLCAPTCEAGYFSPSVTPFSLTCTADVYVDSSGMACEPADTCLAPRNPDPHADYAPCSGLLEGSECTPTCAAGYARTDTPFTLLCDGDGVYDDPGVCAPMNCSKGPTNPSKNVDYTSCLAQHSGETCEPSCIAGYVNESGAAFVLACPDNRFTDFASIVCAEANCTVPSNPHPLGDYGPCMGLQTGDTCVPDCTKGYASTAVSFDLTCDAVSGVFSDESNLVCEGLPCAGGPLDATANVVFSGCNGLRTGEVCEPACAAGYTLEKGDPFTLLCVNGSYLDESGVVCAPEMCTMGPAAPGSNVNYTVCMDIATGDVCVPECNYGFSPSTAATPSPVLCSGGRFVDKTGIVCQGDKCTKGPTTRGPHVDYTACLARVSGDICDPTCDLGFIIAGRSSAFELTCTNLQFADESNITCAPEICSNGPTNPNALVNYTACNALGSGDTCAPDCKTGYVPVTGSPFTLMCVGGWYTDSSGASCKPALCHAPTNPTTNANYSSCTGLTTGDYCTPTCNAGFKRVAGSGFRLDCGPAGDYADSSLISCEGNTCLDGPRTAAPAARYASCNMKVSGEECTPTCPEEYNTSSGRQFTLTCESDRYEDLSHIVCTPPACEEVHSPQANVNYTSCDYLPSGSVCTPSCNNGYRVASQMTDMMVLCTHTDPSYEDTSATECVQGTCKNGPMAPAANADYTACNSLKTGAVCTPSCGGGYTAGRFTPFVLVCDEDAYVDTSGISCAPQTCSQGPTNPSPYADYSSCSKLSTAGVCTPACIPGALQTAKATPFTLTCSGNKYIDTSGIVCRPHTCAHGPAAPGPGVDYASCNDKRTGDACMPTCNPGLVPIGGSPFTLTCINDTYTDMSGLTCSSFSGECIQHGTVCTNAGQDCVDPTNNADDWQCKCNPPYTGPPTTVDVASCILDECQAVCPTCAAATCPAGQRCEDRNTSMSSTGDWICVCDAPTAGSATGAAAVCVLDECSLVSVTEICMNAGQVCYDPDSTELGNWQCRCVAPATGDATQAPAGCMYSGECAAHSVTCSQAGQTCVDPSDRVTGDWRCECVYPETGAPAVGRAAMCVVDECSPNPCSQRQTCMDPNTTLRSTGDFICSCPLPLVEQAVGANATCSEDECITHSSVCRDVGQACVDPDTLVYGDWECRCAGTGVGSAVMAIATCSYSDECCTKAHICTSQGQYCSDPDPMTTNDWTCNCMDAALGHAVAQAAACELDECTASCPTCANSTCSSAGQACVDAQKGSATLNDWRCVCQAPYTGNATTAVASCEIDECVANGRICAAGGQLCEDTNTSVASTNTWQCACKEPKVGFAYGELADCRFSGECVNNHKVCTDAGQTCVDPSDTVLNDWICECIPPQSGANSIGGPALCILDECQEDVCGAGQQCGDPDTSLKSVGDYVCNCTVGIGEAVGGAAVCVLDECLDVGNLLTCVLAGQECIDRHTDATSTGDWVCACTHDVTGEARGRAATCNYEGECILQHARCAPGETCVDPDLTATGDWLCVGGGFDECALHNDTCERGGQSCFDPDPRVASMGDWQCVCKLPLTGFATTAIATCDRDECRSSGALCSQRSQACHDPNPSEQSLNDWQCECVAPATGQPSTGNFANCALDECVSNTVCSQKGQICGDPIPDPMHTGDWQCSCGPGSVGAVATASPAECLPLCAPDAQEGYTASCPSGNLCLASDLLLSCDRGHMGTSPAAVCLVAGSSFTYSGCTDVCSQVTCPDPGPCQQGACQRGVGCVYQTRFGACDDGSNLTTNDQCINGICVGEAPCSRATCRNTNDCLTAACVAGACAQLPRVDGTICNNEGTPGVCSSGQCFAVNRCTGTCKTKDQCHEVGTCDPWSGVCTEPLVSDGTPCDDGNTFTSNDTCVGGVCLGRVVCGSITCTAPQCYAPLCENSNCSSVPIADGTPCDDGEILTLDDVCLGGQCIGTDRCAGVICLDASGCIAAGVCSPVTGQCTQAALPDNTTCDDLQPLTFNDVCLNGACGALCKGVVCPGLSQCRLPARCDGYTGTCHADTFADGTPCDDGDPDTTGDTCLNGVCVGTPPCHNVVCTPLNTCHEAGHCNVTTGRCEQPYKPDGSSCDDSDSTTVQDQCVQGFCRGLRLCPKGLCAIPVQCKDAACGTNGSCIVVNRPDGDLCDDGDSATADSCQQGVCVGCPVCVPLNNCHESAQCNIKTGVCVQLKKPDATPCDDNDPGTINDKCQQGVCVGEQTCGGVLCKGAIDQCLEAACIDNACVIVPVQDGTSCQDGNFHTINDTCISGVCRGIAPCADVQCMPTDQCHGPGTCSLSTGTCSSPALGNGQPCDDGFATTHSDQCIVGVCVGVSRCSAVTCFAYSECHQVGTCDPTSGLCTAPTVADGTLCDSGNGSCQNGLCKRTPACSVTQCTPLTNPCKIHECVDNRCQIRDVADGTPCYDGLIRTFDDKCTNGQCIGVDKCQGVVCTPSSQCVDVGVCDPQTGVCSTPIKRDGEVCNDANPLTVNDKCRAGQCVGHSKCLGVVCFASDGCHTVGVCDDTTGLCSDPPAPDGTACDDGLANTAADRCVRGVCVGTVTCGGTVCKVTDPNCGRAVCDSDGNCVQAAKADGTLCNDHQPATINDQCTNGLCIGHDPCDGVRCSTPSDACLQQGLCLRGRCTDSVASFSQPCDDSDETTDFDTCFAGVCYGTPKCLNKICPGETQCSHASMCVPETGQCTNDVKPDGTACDDGDSGTAGDVCKQGVCVGMAASVVRVQLNMAVPPYQVEAVKGRLANMLAGVLGAEGDVSNAVTVAAQGTTGTAVSVFVKVTNRTGEEAAMDLRNKVNRDIQKGAEGVLYRGGFPTSSAVAEIMRPHDDCAGVVVCESSQQTCVDPTPYLGYEGDWMCRCRPPLRGEAVLKVAGCTTPGGGTVTVAVEVAVDAILESPHANLSDPLAAWSAKVAAQLRIDEDEVYSALDGSTVGADVSVVASFLGDSAEDNRRAFIAAAACCPTSCAPTPAKQDFCQILGISHLPLADIPCSDLLLPDGCKLKPGCLWNDHLCTPGGDAPSGDIAILWLVIAGFATATLIALCFMMRLVVHRASSGGVGAKEEVPAGDAVNPLEGPAAIEPAIVETKHRRGSGAQSLASEESLAAPCASPPTQRPLPSFHEGVPKPVPPIPPMPPRRTSFTNPLTVKTLPGPTRGRRGMPTWESPGSDDSQSVDVPTPPPVVRSGRVDRLRLI